LAEGKVSASGKTLRTDGQGELRLRGLPRGTYRVAAGSTWVETRVRGGGQARVRIQLVP
jgi:hypothetical protein